MARWFIDRGWSPCLPEIHSGTVSQEEREDPELHEMIPGPTRGWHADIAGLVWPTMRRLQIVHIDPWKDNLRGHGPFSWICEVKVSRSDFLKDDKWTAAPQANLQLIAAPKGLISEDEIPNGWGLFEVSGDENGARVFRKTSKLILHPMPLSQDFLIQMLWTLWWRSRGRIFVDIHARATSSYQIEKDSRKVGSIIKATLDYLTDKWIPYYRQGDDPSLESCLQMGGVKRKVPRHITEDTRKLRDELRALKPKSTT
jgi:hypothetical protein